MSQQKIAVLTTTVAAAAAISEYQAVGYDNDVAAAQAAVRGFATTDAALGDKVAIDRLGTTIAIASGVITDGDDLEVGASGALRKATTGGIIVAVAEQDAADGERFEAFILPRATNAFTATIA